MSQTLRLDIRGLYTDPNPLSQVPRGALTVANNMVINSPSIAESRRGLKQYADILDDAHKLFSFQDTLIVHDDDKLKYDNSGVWTNLTGTFNAPMSPLQMQAAELNKSLYLTTDLGVYKLDSPNSTPARSGIVAALDIAGALTGAAGFMATNTSVAYRLVWGRKDSNDLLLLGAPSARAIVRNSSGGNRNVSLTFTIPSEVTTSYFYQIYRSEQTTASTSEPSDELQLIYEKSPSGGEIVAGTVTYTDSITDDLKGALIYTAPSQEGIDQQNTRPPFAADICEFKQHLFYFNVKQPYRLIMSFISNAIANDTVTIAGVTYTAKGAENIAADQFLVGATIDITLRSLIRVVNRSTSTTLVYLYEVDGKTFLAETRALPGASFTITSSNAGLFDKTVPVTASNDARQDGVYISKAQQGDAVPLLNFIPVGSGSKAIVRGISIRDAAFPLKEDGVFRITGTDTSNFTLEAHDLTTNIVGPNTAVRFGNAVFMDSDRGPCVITPSDISHDIGNPLVKKILELNQFSNFADTAWALSYESEDKYILSCPTTELDTVATQQFVYNAHTDSWTRWLLNIPTGVINTADNKLYVVRDDDQQTLQERKDFSLDDYADDEFPVTISASTGDTLTLSAGIGDCVIGQSIRQDDNEAVITDINGSVLTIEPIDLTWANAAATVYNPIEVQLKWSVEDANNPGILKHYSEATFFFTDASFNEINATFASNLEPGDTFVPLEADGVGEWGEFNWPDEGDDAEWGGGLGGFQPIRTYFPKNLTRASWVQAGLVLAQAFTSFSVAGVSMITEKMSSRFR